MDENNKELFTLIAEYNLSKTVIPAGLQNDISGLMSCLDLHILSSSAESFGNVIAETMSCGVTNISTDVGEARKIIGDTGIIIPSCDPEGLSKAIITLINDKDLISGSNRANCRKRIEMLYNSWSMLESYKKVWNEI